MITLKEGADPLIGIKLSFNAAMYRNLFRKHNGAKNHYAKVKAEEELDKWLKANISGLPDDDLEEQNR